MAGAALGRLGNAGREAHTLGYLQRIDLTQSLSYHRSACLMSRLPQQASAYKCRSHELQCISATTMIF
jgi:hypothetical protein